MEWAASGQNTADYTRFAMKLIIALITFTLMAPNVIIMGQGYSEFFPCFCCLDTQSPKLPWYSYFLLIFPFLGYCLLMYYLEKGKIKKQQMEKKKMIEKYGDWVGREVKIGYITGRVVRQDNDILYINYLNDFGSLSQTTRKIAEVN